MTKQKQGINTKKGKRDISNPKIEESFVIYDLENPPFERLHLCKYLLELPDLEEEDNPKAD